MDFNGVKAHSTSQGPLENKGEKSDKFVIRKNSVHTPCHLCNYKYIYMLSHLQYDSPYFVYFVFVMNTNLTILV
jgi:hypothetical protein